MKHTLTSVGILWLFQLFSMNPQYCIGSSALWSSVLNSPVFKTQLEYLGFLFHLGLYSALDDSKHYLTSM